MKEIKESVIVYTTKPLSGYFSCALFNVLPSKIRNNKYYSVILQFSNKIDEPYFRFSNNNSDSLSKKIIELNILLSVFTQFYFFGFRKRSKPIKHFTVLKNFDKIKYGTIQWYQDKSLDDRNVDSIIFPEEINILFRAYFSLNEKKLKILQRAISLFYSGIELKLSYPSQSFLCFVSAIETLTQVEFEKEDEGIIENKCCHTIIESPWKCDECKSPLWGIGQKYRKFLKKYAYNNEIDQNGKKLINKIYSIRSKIVHFGQLLYSDNFWKESDEPHWDESFLHKDLLHITRISILNWLLHNADAS